MTQHLSCADCRERLASYVASQLASRDRIAVERHLAGCVECRRALAHWEEIAGALHEADQRILPNGHATAVWDAIEARIDDSPARTLKGSAFMTFEPPHETDRDQHTPRSDERRPRANLPRRTFPLAAAALLLVIAGGFLWNATRPQSATSHPGPASSASPSSTAIATSTAVPNGCPLQQDPGTLPATDIVVTQVGLPGTTPSPAPYDLNMVPLQVGQTIQIRLDANFKWTLTSSNNAGILSGNPPLGGYSRTLGDCIWRYTATAVGVAKLYFTGTPVCATGQACPAIATIANYEITVKP